MNNNGTTKEPDTDRTYYKDECTSTTGLECIEQRRITPPTFLGETSFAFISDIARKSSNTTLNTLEKRISSADTLNSPEPIKGSIIIKQSPQDTGDTSPQPSSKSNKTEIYHHKIYQTPITKTTVTSNVRQPKSNNPINNKVIQQERCDRLANNQPTNKKYDVVRKNIENNNCIYPPKLVYNKNIPFRRVRYFNRNGSHTCSNCIVAYCITCRSYVLLYQNGY